MLDFADISDQLIHAYNAKDFDAMARIIAPDIDFAHYNRDFLLSTRQALLDVLRHFAAELIPDRTFLEPERVTLSGNVVVRESFYTGTARADLPGFPSAGNAFKLKFCSVMRFSDDGRLVEWKDYG